MLAPDAVITQRVIASRLLRPKLFAAAQSFRGAIADLHHTILDLWEVGDGMVVALTDVHYRRLDGRELNLPCCNVFGIHDGVVNDYRIYMDVSPVLAP